MLCTFCGTDNRPEHKFCGMCGVRLERRKEQRRVRQTTGTVKCQACGHVNESQTKFCGMCGLRVERRSAERRANEDTPVDHRATAEANAQLPTPEAPGKRTPLADVLDVLAPTPQEELDARRAADNIFHSRPSPQSPTTQSTTISGPSFLGLGNDSEAEPVQYLLEDEPSSSRGGLIFFVIILLLGGLGYVAYRSGYLANLQTATANKRQTAPPLTVPQATPDGSPAASSEDTASNPQKQSANPSSAKDSLPALAKQDPSTAEDGPADPETANKKNEAAASVDPPARASDNDKPSAQGKPAKQAAGKETAASEIVPPAKRKPSAALIQAQNYLQGKGGVPQSCEQGLIYLKAATEKNDPAAAVQMGALYASGHCVQQDRVMAYRWFNSAHELDPANPWIQTNLDTLWAQMSAQEKSQVAR